VYPGWHGIRSLRWYLDELWAPATQIVSAVQTGSLAFNGVALAALAAALALLRRTWRAAAFWLGWEAVLLMPTVGFAAVASYRQYVPNLGAAALSGLITAQAFATTYSWRAPFRWIPIAVAAGFFAAFARELPAAAMAWVP
jgi:hypothetical protein